MGSMTYEEDAERPKSALHAERGNEAQEVAAGFFLGLKISVAVP